MQNNQEVTLSSGKCILSPKHMKQFSFIKYSSNKFMDIYSGFALLYSTCKIKTMDGEKER